MLTLSAFSIRPMIRLVVQCLAILLFAIPAAAQGNSSNYVFLLASGFLCDPGDTSTCPAAVKANAGGSYEMSGAGTFETQSKSVKAAGNFTHKSPNGNVLETGVWTASELVSFDSYGAAPGAIQRQGLAYGLGSLGSKRLPMDSGPVPTGGLAVFRIRLLPMRGPSRTAVLQVNCPLSQVPRERSVEGIRLTLESNGTEFSEEVGGRVVFLAMPPEGGALAKPQQQEVAPETSEPSHN